MKGCFTTLFLAFIAAIIAAFFGRSCHHERVQDLLTQRVAAELKSTYPNVNVKYDHLTGLVTGQVAPVEMDEIRKRVKDLTRGNGRVYFNLEEKAKDPSSFAIVRSNGKITLTGTVDSEQTRAILAEAVKMEGMAVENNLTAGSNTAAYPHLGPVVAAIPQLIKSASDARIEAGPDRLTISGEVANDGVKNKLVGLFSKEQMGGSAIEEQIRVKAKTPSDFTVARNGKKLTVTGTVDSAETKTRIGDQARLSGATVDNRLTVGNHTAPLPNLGSALAAIPSLLDADNSKMVVNQKNVAISGMVDDAAAKGKLLAHFSADKWKGATISDQITLRAPPTFSWKQDNAETATLSGTVPNARIKKALVDAAKKRLGPRGKVIDQMKVSSDVLEPEWLKGLPVFVTQSLPNVIDPIINITNEVATISGTVADSTAMNDISLAFSGINPPGKVDFDLKVAPPTPPTPTPTKRTKDPVIEITGQKGKIALAGMVPDQKTYDLIVKSAISGKGIANIDKKLKVEETVKEETYLKPLPTFIEAFYNGNVTNREVWLKNKELTLKGVLPSDAEKNKTLALANPLQAQGVKIVDQLTVKPTEVAMVTPKPPVKPADPPKMVKVTPKPPVKPADPPKMVTVTPKPPVKPADPPKMVAVTPKPPVKPADPPKPAPKPIDPKDGSLHSVYFGTGEFHIRNSEVGRVYRLVQEAKTSSGKIVIDGFADQRGTAELNAFLSEQRAKKIRQYLIDHGIESDRIISVTGHGALTGKSGEVREYRRTDVQIMK